MIERCTVPTSLGVAPVSGAALLSAAALVACTPPDADPDRLEIDLTRGLTGNESPLAGLTNVFFTTPDPGVVERRPADAEDRELELAVLYDGGDEGPTIHIARYRDASGSSSTWSTPTTISILQTSVPWKWCARGIS